MKPMLASESISASQALLPAYYSVKLDGIRSVTTDEGARTRSLKPVPNKHIAAMLATLPSGLDGELAVLGADGAPNFRETTSAVMRQTGEPGFTYYVFDLWNHPEMAFTDRYSRLCAMENELPGWVTIVEQTTCHTVAEIEAMYERVLAEGHEGLIGRRPSAHYKFGRATPKSMDMFKLKPFVDAEARIVAVTEMMRNTNEAFKNELGRSARSSAKAGLVGAGVLGTLVCETADGTRFEIGTGYDMATRAELYEQRDALPSQYAKYRYLSVGGYDAPRSASFLGIRAKEDMDANR